MSENNTPNTQETIDSGIPRVSFRVRVAQLVQQPVDPTLEVEGMPADAKATGEAIAQAKEDLQEEIDSLDEDISAIAGLLFPVGSIYTSTSATAPTFGGANWNWKEILVPVTHGDLESGARSYVEKGETDTPGTLHFWKRLADTEVNA